MRFLRSPQVWELVTIARNPDIKSGQEEDTHGQTGDEASKMTIAKSHCESDPMAWDIAAGNRPKVATSMGIREMLARCFRCPKTILQSHPPHLV